jgi:hypothetical protein
MLTKSPDARVNRKVDGMSKCGGPGRDRRAWRPDDTMSVLGQSLRRNT